MFHYYVYVRCLEKPFQNTVLGGMLKPTHSLTHCVTCVRVSGVVATCSVPIAPTTRCQCRSSISTSRSVSASTATARPPPPIPLLPLLTHRTPSTVGLSHWSAASALHCELGPPPTMSQSILAWPARMCGPFVDPAAAYVTSRSLGPANQRQENIYYATICCAAVRQNALRCTVVIVSSQLMSLSGVDRCIGHLSTLSGGITLAKPLSQWTL